MTTIFLPEGTPIVAHEEHPHAVGVGTQHLFRFENGYGASVVRFSIGGWAGSYGVDQGLWELAVLQFDGPTLEGYRLTYDTPVTDDVVGYLTPEQVRPLLLAIAALPAE